MKVINNEENCYFYEHMSMYKAEGQSHFKIADIIDLEYNIVVPNDDDCSVSDFLQYCRRENDRIGEAKPIWNKHFLFCTPTD